MADETFADFECAGCQAFDRYDLPQERNCALTYGADEYPTDGFMWASKWSPDVSRRCPLSVILADDDVRDYLQLHSDMKCFSVLPMPGGLFAQPDRVMRLVRVIEAEQSRIEAQKMREASEKK